MPKRKTGKKQCNKRTAASGKSKVVKRAMPATRTKKGVHDKLDHLREQILTTSWHPLQTESYVKQLFVQLIDALKERP